MQCDNINARNAPDPHGGYSQAIKLQDHETLLPNSRKIRADYLGSLALALTVVIANVFDEKRLLEVEAVAVQ